MLENSPIRYLKGVGPKLDKTLAKVGIFSVKDLLYYFPREYEDRKSICPISKVKVGEEALIQGKIVSLTRQKTRRNYLIIKTIIKDASGCVGIIWYNQPFLFKVFKKGTELFLKGRLEYNSYSRETLFIPRYYEIKGDEDVLPVVPIYPLTEGLFQKKLRALIRTALDDNLSKIQEHLPERIRKEYKLTDLHTALVKLHYPKDIDEAKEAKRRMLFDELFIFQLGILLRRKIFKEKLKGIAFKIKADLTGSFLASLPFILTASQKMVISEIEQDMAKHTVMNRLLQGDVGSGKTIVAIYAMVIAIQNGYQVAFMAPTEILANQHYNIIKELLSELDIKIILLTGGENVKTQEQKYEQISGSEPLIVVGTHALIEERVKYGKLGLVIIDEQQRFGVAQRHTLRTKGEAPDLLVMTATPIPRSLALTLYGDLDRSVIKEMPPGRTPVVTRFVEDKGTEKMYRFINNEINSGRQAYIVYPLVEESEVLDLKAVKTEFSKIKDKFPVFNVGLIYGGLKGEEKDRIMRDFKEGKTNILVSTTVIEVGIDVPNATIMVIEHAERFGLSQLHQLRGRIGRGIERSYCFLVSDPRNETAKSRIKAMLDSTDGFYIAEVDLKIRGPGEILGMRQSGISFVGNLPNFRVADIINEDELLTVTRNAAEQCLLEDPYLTKQENLLLRQDVLNKYKELLELGALD